MLQVRLTNLTITLNAQPWIGRGAMQVPFEAEGRAEGRASSLSFAKESITVEVRV